MISRPQLLALAVLAACAHLPQQGAPEPVRSPEQLSRDFHRAVDTFLQNQRPGGAPDAPGLVKLAARMLEAAGVAAEFSGKPGDLTLTLSPSVDTPLNRLALQVRDTVGGRVIYDVRYLLENPGANATFDPATNVLRLPHAAVADLNADEPTVRHEMVHARTWATLRSGWPSPYEGALRGPPFQPELSLDEMDAYAEDVRFAAAQLAEVLRRDPDPPGRIARSDLAGILRVRLSEKRPDGELSFLERVFDRLASRIIAGGWSTFPAAEVLGAMKQAAADPSRVSYQAWREGTQGLIRAAVPMREKGPVEVTLALYLPSSTGPADPKNPQILWHQLASAQEAARRHAGQLTRAMAQLHALVEEVSPARKAERILAPGLLAGDGAP